jgi:basic amino acid/polyamine antiporter, APA family
VTAPAVTRAELVRGLGLAAAVAVNVANMIGTGVFLKARVMTCNVGAATTVLGVWVAAGLLSLAGTFSYAEVAAMIPEAGGDYVFLRRAYGRLVGFVCGWTTFTVVKAGAQAALAVGFAIFLNVALGGGLEADVVRAEAWRLPLHVSGLTVVALAAIWVVALINCRPVATGGHAALVLTILKVLLLATLAAGALGLAHGSFAHLAEPAAGGRCDGVASTARGGVAGFGAAMLGALWAYDGWNNVTPLAGEIKDPARNLPRAFVGGLVLVGALYLAVNLAYFYVLTPTEVSSVAPDSSVATEVAQRFLGPAAVTFVAVALMLSSFGSLQASVLAGSRIPFAMAREGLFFRALARVSPATRVPVHAIIAQAAWASMLAASGSYDTLTDSVIFASWLFYGLSAGSLFVFRRTLPDAVRPYRAFGYPFVPAVFIAVTVWLIVNTFVATPRLALVGVAVMLAGLPFYLWWSRTAARLTPTSQRADRADAAGR